MPEKANVTILPTTENCKRIISVSVLAKTRHWQIFSFGRTALSLNHTNKTFPFQYEGSTVVQMSFLTFLTSLPFLLTKDRR